MKILVNEFKRLFIRYKKHYIQYTLLTITMCIVFIYGMYYKGRRYGCNHV